LDTKKLSHKIIGIYSPRPQSGKTTLANFLVDHFNFELRSFSSPIKQMVNCLLENAGIEPDMIEHLSSQAKLTPIPKMGAKSYRDLCQTLGTDWGRGFIKPTLWIDLTLHYQRHTRSLVFDDVRFEDEFYAIKELGGEVWKIFRDDTKSSNDHPSEGRLKGFNFDRILTNNSSLVEFYNQLIL